MKDYSLLIGLRKGLVFILMTALTWLVAAGLADIEIWSLIEQHIKPIIGGLTLGGLLTVCINYLKVTRAG